MEVLVNYIYCYDVVHSTTTVAQRNPIVPREGELVRIEVGLTLWKASFISLMLLTMFKLLT